MSETKTTLADCLCKKVYVVSGFLSIENAKLAVVEWLAGKLVAGSEKANSHNEVILKLLAELKDGENKQVETMIMRKEEYDDVMAKNRDMCKCGHIRMFHSVSNDGRESTWCCKFECECKKFTLDKPKTTEKE